MLHSQHNIYFSSHIHIKQSGTHKSVYSFMRVAVVCRKGSCLIGYNEANNKFASYRYMHIIS
jgi:hypothetical protein